MAITELLDDEDGYLAWIASNLDGYVINILRGHNPSTARLHRASCRTISGENPRGGAWTGPYVKVCAENLADLIEWANSNAGQSIPLCGICRPTSDNSSPTASKPTKQPVTPPVPEPTPSPRPTTLPQTVAAPESRFEAKGPLSGAAVVEAWADEFVLFERRPAWQEQLRDEIRSYCRQLEPSGSQILHATYFGPKPPKADVENLVLYYIDSFAHVGRNGIRFEHGAAVPLAPSGIEYAVGYRYTMASKSDSFAHWQQSRVLASFDWTDLGAFAGEKKLEQVWFALGRGESRIAKPARAPDTPFAVKLQLRPPRGYQLRVNSNLVKAIFDGVICACQAHTDTASLPEITSRIAAHLNADPTEVESLLLDRHGAVLGVVPRLVHHRSDGVQWNPVDHWCVAGELVATQPVDDRWAISGEIVELSR